jgi:mono/diheme cytochrome c family protein
MVSPRSLPPHLSKTLYEKIRAMPKSKQLATQALILFLAIGTLAAQEPTVTVVPTNPPSANDLTQAAIAGSKEDPAAVQRGTKLYTSYCAGCHGVAGRGGPGAPDLVRSLVVLDDEKGLLIGPVLRNGRADKGMPNLGLTEPQIADLVAWLHAKTYAAGHRTTYTFKDVLTGNAKQGEAYFNGAGTCATCHSATGDLAHVGTKYDPFSLQSRWLQPQSRNPNARSDGSAAETVTVTPSDGHAVTGTLDRIDDFTVSLHDASGNFHSFFRNGAEPQVVVKNPLQAHTDLLRKYTDADIHNITAYLVTLK